MSHEEAEGTPPKKPLFTYTKGEVNLLGLHFDRIVQVTPGPDPYGGPCWVARLGNNWCMLGELRIELSDVVLPRYEIRWQRKGTTIFKKENSQYTHKQMPFWWRWTFNQLQRARMYWEYVQAQTPDENYDGYWGGE